MRFTPFCGQENEYHAVDDEEWRNGFFEWCEIYYKED